MYMRSWEFYPDLLDFHWLEDIKRFQNKSEWVERFQPGWVLYCMIIRSISESFYVLQIVTALIFNIAAARVIKRHSPYPFLTILIFYVNFKFLEFEFEIMRETVAVSVFLLLSFDNYIRKKWIPYYIGVIIAFSIHNSAILMFVLPLLRNINWSLKKYSVTMVLPSFFLSVAGRVVLGNIISIIFVGSGFISEYIAKASENETNLNYLLMYGCQPVMLYILCCVCYKYITDRNLRVLVFFSLIFMNFNMIYFTAGRLVNYIVLPVYIAITPIFFHLIKKFHTVFIAIVLCLLYSVPAIYILSDKGSRARYYPYQWVINPQQTHEQKHL